MLKRIDPEKTAELKAWLEGRVTTTDPETVAAVAKIVEDVRISGNDAVVSYTEKFDGVVPDMAPLSDTALKALAAQADPAFVSALERAARNITAFHEAQKQNSYILNKEDGVYLGQRVLPLDAVGLYVPGGRAQYPSSVLMNAIPARIAGVPRIVMCTPHLSPEVAAAATVAGVTEIYPIGGAQAVAALAYGTETIAPVDKIIGPGNIFVATAKRLVYGKVDIDMIAGPSEILVIADSGANPAHVAADLLSQAEHDPLASAILLCTDENLLVAVEVELERQLSVLPKREIAQSSIENYGRAIVCDSIATCIAISNAIAPEHLELMVENPMDWLGQVRHAGSVFLGYWTCESIGDYYGGTNHVLPTSGTARFSSALGVDAFIKKSSFLHYSEAALQKAAADIVTLAEVEDLQAHANAVKVRT